MDKNLWQMGRKQRGCRTGFTFSASGDDALAGTTYKCVRAKRGTKRMGQGIGLIGILSRNKQKREVNVRRLQLISDGLCKFFGGGLYLALLGKG
jgi:hypothetical protein